jgi:lipopolysaccharide biosynthesis glycosyltransferase
MKPTLFIHTNEKQYFGAKISEYSFRRFSSHNDEFDIRIINLPDFDMLNSRHLKKYMRQGDLVRFDRNDLQSFTLLRFLPPSLMNFRNRAIVVDPDVFALTDIWDLFDYQLDGRSIAARRILGKDNQRPYFATSVMLLECEKLKHWQWEKDIEDLFAGKIDYRDWMSLFREDPASISVLDDSWNHYDFLDSSTKLLHNTGRITQPWKTGLRVDFSWDSKSYLDKEADLFKRTLFRLKRWKTNYTKPRRYLNHPDKNQEDFFFSLVRGALESGHITEQDLSHEIKRKNIRPDALKLVEKSKFPQGPSLQTV